MTVSVVLIIDDPHVFNSLCLQRSDHGNLVVWFSEPRAVVVEPHLQSVGFCCVGDRFKSFDLGSDAAFLLFRGAGINSSPAPAHPELGLHLMTAE